ncbi:hypothetical protein [Paenibacillus chitinolyticus]|uniref:hypothetical protein n=1 Tax=Paenibacillus chitinolyticus TaxID=79263 RepID=UPI003CFD2E3F
MALTQEHSARKFKRITPEQVREAFKNTGLVPKKHTFGDGRTCGCAITAIAVESKPGCHRNFYDFVESMGYDGEYLYYFINGFDGKNNINFLKLSEIYLIGYRDGEAARRLIFMEGNK